MDRLYYLNLLQVRESVAGTGKVSRNLATGKTTTRELFTDVCWESSVTIVSTIESTTFSKLQWANNTELTRQIF